MKPKSEQRLNGVAGNDDIPEVEFNAKPEIPEWNSDRAWTFAKWFALISFILMLIWALSGCTNKDTFINVNNCNDTITEIHPGDTIIFRYPDIPKILTYRNSRIQTYYNRCDSVVITYNHCN